MPRDTQLNYQWGTLYKAYKPEADSKIEPEHVAKELRAALETTGKVHELTAPVAVVDRARSPKNLLHSFFEWDDDVASEAWRREQARDLLHGIRVVAVRVLEDGSTDSAEPVAAFASVRLPEVVGRTYVEVTTAAATTTGRAALLHEARLQLQSARKRFGSLQELSKIMRSIDRFLDDGKAA